MRLGIFGGSFDPIHYGHLRMAEALRDRFALDLVLFVPNQVSPFKQSETVTPAELRAELVERAIANNPKFGVWRGELEKPGPSYTVETLRRLAEEFPGSERFFLTGNDAVRDIAKWREPEACLALAQFISVFRPGVSEAAARLGIPDHLEKKIEFVELNGLDISSTDIRKQLLEQRSVRYLVPESVIECIETHGLYTAKQ
jgi:nicotinate-nucleotide adenylyltransferase